jgi:glycosyltransferase involved in cell wall biosynthesis
VKRISFVTVNYNNHKGLLKTLNAICKLKSLLPKDIIELIVVDGCSSQEDIEIIDKYREHIDKVLIEKDEGIYDAMNKGLSIANGDFVNFMNSGDVPLVNEMISFIKSIDSIDKIFCGEAVWSKKVSALFINTTSPFWMKMPNHQAMFVPLKYHKENLYNLSYPIAADLDFKLKAFKKIGFIFKEYKIVLSEPGGKSQTIRSINELLKRAKEIKDIARIHSGNLSAYINYLKFILWHCRRLF